MNETDARTRAENVGSMLRSPEVVAALKTDDPHDREIVDAAVLAAIKVQQDSGLDVITDGELRRSNWTETPHMLDCFEPSEMEGGLNWRGGTRAPTSAPRKAFYDIVVRPVRDAKPIADRTAQYAFLAQHAGGVRTKFTMAAPSYHRRYWNDELSREAYGSIEEFLGEIRDHLRDVTRTLVALGCDYIQLDAPNYGSLCDPDTRAKLAAEGHDLEAELAFDAALDSSVFEGISGATRALHICRGNAPGGRWHSAGGYGAISKQLFHRLDFDRLMLEYDSERAGTFGPLADVRPGVVAVLGLLTTKTGDLEDEQLVRERIAEAATLKSLDELAVSTQCGFASGATGYPLTPEEQQRKLALVGRIAHGTWNAGAA